MSVPAGPSSHHMPPKDDTYPHDIWFFLASLIALISLCQFISFLLGRVTKSPSGGGFRRIPVAAVNAYRALAFRTTVAVAEVACAMMYIAVLFAWELVHTTDTLGNKFSAGYMSNRAGTIAVSQFPLIAVLGTKNNILGSASRTDGRWGLQFLQLGLMALVAFSVLIVISLRPIRARAYELFFYSHFVLVLMFLIGAYFHTKPYAFNPYIYSTFIIWGLDRVIRLIRLVVFNHTFSLSHSNGREMDATVEPLSPHLTAYLITPQVSMFPLEAHPFTIASYDSPSGNQDEDGGEQGLKKGAEDVYWKELVFLINVQEGFTKRLAASNGPIKVYIDGPYGPSPNLSRFDSVAFVAGGSGVSYTLPLLLDTIERARSGKGTCKRVLFIWAIRDSTHVHWMSDVLLTALAHDCNIDLDVQIFVTKPGATEDVVQWDDTSVNSQPEGESQAAPDKPTCLGLKINAGRPDLDAILKDEAERTQGGCMAVTVCGSRQVAQAVRDALRYPLTDPMNVVRGGASVSLHVESFGYA
ncbi:hypothetical protein BDZ89DRAFT_1075648 [Hymenopellis radicata]|nr:hypothetical protein BDZ89DRAFT_1075648 [Hymenopellis radicata]